MIRSRLVAGAVAVVLVVFAIAADGPEPPNTLDRDPTLYVQNRNGPGHTRYVTLAFKERPEGLTGWDFGGRGGYACGFMELVEGNGTTTISDDVVLAKLILEKYADSGGTNPDAPMYAVLNSNLGAGQESCSETGTTAVNVQPASTEERAHSFGGPGEPSFAHGHVIQIWRDTNGAEPGGFVEITGTPEVPRVQVPHEEFETYQGSSTIGPNTSWWFRGDSDAEILLWYENPAVSSCLLGDGTTANPCYGIIARLSVSVKVPGIVADDCVLNNPEGTPCPQAFPNEPLPPPPVPVVTIGSGTSELVCSDASNPAVSQLDPLRATCP